jgi:hypothetical protein
VSQAITATGALNTNSKAAMPPKRRIEPKGKRTDSRTNRLAN